MSSTWQSRDGEHYEPAEPIKHTARWFCIVFGHVYKGSGTICYRCGHRA